MPGSGLLRKTAGQDGFSTSGSHNRHEGRSNGASAFHRTCKDGHFGEYPDIRFQKEMPYNTLNAHGGLPSHRLLQKSDNPERVYVIIAISAGAV
jgi:hypothetical protein